MMFGFLILRFGDLAIFRSGYSFIFYFLLAFSPHPLPLSTGRGGAVRLNFSKQRIFHIIFYPLLDF
jgi:hypothetical protein